MKEYELKDTELTTVETLKIIKEICDAHNNDCGKCPLCIDKDYFYDCLVLDGKDEDPEKIIEICKQWKADHEEKEPEAKSYMAALVYADQESEYSLIKIINIDPESYSSFATAEEHTLQNYYETRCKEIAAKYPPDYFVTMQKIYNAC